jgi:hypothetical protein
MKLKKGFFKRVEFFFILIFLVSCSGYRIQNKDNPLERYDIRTLRVPVFYNESALNFASGPFTSEFRRLLLDYPGLRISNSEFEKVDAVLIGIIQSNKNINQTIRNSALRVANPGSRTEGDIPRRSFYVPASSQVHLQLRLVLIKNPSDKELKLIQSGLLNGIRWDNRILLDETLNLTGGFTREFYEGEASSVLYTQNEGALNKTVTQMASQAVDQFRDTILYAF